MGSVLCVLLLPAFGFSSSAVLPEAVVQEALELQRDVVAGEGKTGDTKEATGKQQRRRRARRSRRNPVRLTPVNVNVSQEPSEEEAAASGGDGDGDGSAAPNAAAESAVADAPEDVPEEVPVELDLAEYGRVLQQRNAIASIHKPLGIATWASMGITLLLGGIQYHNLYGQFSALEDTPCVTGDAIFGQGQCSGTPVPHLVSALTTTALYSATFTLSMLMPDPGDLDEGDSDYASNLRLHKILRWVHFGGMIAQLALGAVIANGERFGLDRANNYETLRTLSTVHLGLGLVTWGALTWSGALFAF